MSAHPELAFDLDLLRKTARYIGLFRSWLSLNIRLSGEHSLIDSGDIFLFNHFARFETFIPQYLFFEHKETLCRSVASAEFFEEDSRFSDFLKASGAVPNNLPDLIPFLVRELLLGRKVIIFPEGGMVKDKQVLDDTGRYNIYSRSANRRRKHHTGAALLGVTLATVKSAIRAAARSGAPQLQGWCDALSISDPSRLRIAAEKPTRLVPANITFYPMRISGNLLQRGVELVTGGKLSRRLSEELLIEGNMLLKETDMDIRMGEPIEPDKFLHWWERRMIRGGDNAMRMMGGEHIMRPMLIKARERVSRKVVARIRDEYMVRIYQGVTINLAHIASLCLLAFAQAGRMEISRERLFQTIYLCVKRIQDIPNLNLHESLVETELYHTVLDGRSAPLNRFLEVCRKLQLIGQTAERIELHKRLLKNVDFDTVRIENPVTVYANEVEPITQLLDVVDATVAEIDMIPSERIAHHRFEDMRRAHRQDEKRFRSPEYNEINALQTADADAAPFLLRPQEQSNVGVVLIHGFLASPSEVLGLGEALQSAGFNVIGVRLKGHGTSPWDLRASDHEAWRYSVYQGLRLMRLICTEIHVVGFSTGGLLGLDLAAAHPESVKRVVAINAPIRFLNRNIMFAPVIADINRAVRALSSLEGMWVFKAHESENPQINYAHIPIRALAELHELVGKVKEVLAKVNCPTLLIQGRDDPVVNPDSAQTIFDALGSNHKRVLEIETDRHGIVYRDTPGVSEAVTDFLRVPLTT